MRAPEDKPDALPNAVCATMLAADTIVPVDASMQHSAPELNARLQNVFIEQQSTVSGIQELVQ